MVEAIISPALSVLFKFWPFAALAAGLWLIVLSDWRKTQNSRLLMALGCILTGAAIGSLATLAQ